jgi:MYXO-CTERM domain-containing protein
LKAACEGFDCGVHGSCVPMNGNPTCQCEGGYAAVLSTTYDTNGASNKVTCQPVPGPIAPLPRLPNVGSTTLPSAGGQSGSGGCNVAPRSGTGSAAGLVAVLGLALAGARRRRR